MINWLLPLVFFFALDCAFANDDISDIIPGAPASIKKIEPLMIGENEFEEDRYILRIELGKLSPETFLEIKKIYNNSSNIKYNSSQQYLLSDFLPPFAQAFNNKLFPPSTFDYNSDLADLFDEAWPLVKNGAEVSSNCWNTSIEYLMSMFGTSDNEAYLYVADMNDVTIFFNTNSKIVNESDADIGDVLVISESNNNDVGHVIQHTAVIVGPNLVFEKTAPDENAPFRISFLSDIKRKFDKLMTDPNWLIPKVTFTYHRFDKKNVIRPSLSSLGQLYGDPISDELAEELVKRQPSVKPGDMLQTCFPGIGGGCDPFISVLNKVKLDINESGRHQVAEDMKGLFLNLAVD